MDWNLVEFYRKLNLRCRRDYDADFMPGDNTKWPTQWVVFSPDGGPMGATINSSGYLRYMEDLIAELKYLLATSRDATVDGAIASAVPNPMQTSTDLVSTDGGGDLAATAIVAAVTGAIEVHYLSVIGPAGTDAGYFKIQDDAGVPQILFHGGASGANQPMNAKTTVGQDLDIVMVDMKATSKYGVNVLWREV